jgi:hypothetical protein
MKKTILSVFSLFFTGLLFAQNPTAKIVLNNDEKITVEKTLNFDASVMGMGMSISNHSTTFNSLVVKNSTDKNYTIINTLTKVKTDINAMGENQSYNSETDDANSDIGKAMSSRLNKPEEVLIDKNTGDATFVTPKEKKKSDEDGIPMEGLMNMIGDNSADAMVSAAFELIPQGKKIGDHWSDSSSGKEGKVVRNYTLKAIDGNIATVGLDAKITANTKVDFQEMEMELKSTTVTTGEFTTDIITGKVKKKTTNSNIEGSVQIMGQDVSITATAVTSTVYN